jgi:hypothetical protein
VIQDLPEFGRGLRALAEMQVSQATQVHHLGVSALIRGGGCQQFHCFGGLFKLAGNAPDR